MHKNIKRNAATPCAGFILIHPSGIRAQMLSVDPSTRTNVQVSSEMHREKLDTHSLNIRDWSWSDTQSAFHASPPFRTPRLPTPHYRQHSRAYRSVQRVLAGAALGLVGAYVGFAAVCSCECGGNDTVYVGMGTGAGIGAIAGAMLVR